MNNTVMLDKMCFITQLYQNLILILMVGHSSLKTTQRYFESDSESQMKVVSLI